MKFSPAFAAIIDKPIKESDLKKLRKEIYPKDKTEKYLRFKELLQLKYRKERNKNEADAIKILVLIDEIEKLGYTKSIHDLKDKLIKPNHDIGLYGEEGWKKMVIVLEYILYRLKAVLELKNQDSIKEALQIKLEGLYFDQCANGAIENAWGFYNSIPTDASLPSITHKSQFLQNVAYGYAIDTGLIKLAASGEWDTHIVNDLLYYIKEKYNIKVEKFLGVVDYNKGKRFVDYLENYLSSPKAVIVFCEHIIKDAALPNLPNPNDEYTNKKFLESVSAVMQRLEFDNLDLFLEGDEACIMFKYKENYNKLLQVSLLEKLNSKGIIEGGVLHIGETSKIVHIDNKIYLLTFEGNNQFKDIKEIPQYLANQIIAIDGIVKALKLYENNGQEEEVIVDAKNISIRSKNLLETLTQNSENTESTESSIVTEFSQKSKEELDKKIFKKDSIPHWLNELLENEIKDNNIISALELKLKILSPEYKDFLPLLNKVSADQRTTENVKNLYSTSITAEVRATLQYLIDQGNTAEDRYLENIFGYGLLIKISKNTLEQFNSVIFNNNYYKLLHTEFLNWLFGNNDTIRLWLLKNVITESLKCLFENEDKIILSSEEIRLLLLKNLIRKLDDVSQIESIVSSVNFYTYKNIEGYKVLYAKIAEWKNKEERKLLSTKAFEKLHQLIKNNELALAEVSELLKLIPIENDTQGQITDFLNDKDCRLNYINYPFYKELYNKIAKWTNEDERKKLNIKAFNQLKEEAETLATEGVSEFFMLISTKDISAGFIMEFFNSNKFSESNYQFYQAVYKKIAEWTNEDERKSLSTKAFDVLKNCQNDKKISNKQLSELLKLIFPYIKDACKSFLEDFLNKINKNSTNSLMENIKDCRLVLMISLLDYKLNNGTVSADKTSIRLHNTFLNELIDYFNSKKEIEWSLASLLELIPADSLEVVDFTKAFRFIIDFCNNSKKIDSTEEILFIKGLYQKIEEYKSTEFKKTLYKIMFTELIPVIKFFYDDRQNTDCLSLLLELIPADSLEVEDFTKAFLGMVKFGIDRKKIHLTKDIAFFKVLDTKIKQKYKKIGQKDKDLTDKALFFKNIYNSPEDNAAEKDADAARKDADAAKKSIKDFKTKAFNELINGVINFNINSEDVQDLVVLITPDKMTAWDIQLYFKMVLSNKISIKGAAVFFKALFTIIENCNEEKEKKTLYTYAFENLFEELNNIHADKDYVGIKPLIDLLNLIPIKNINEDAYSKVLNKFKLLPLGANPFHEGLYKAIEQKKEEKNTLYTHASQQLSATLDLDDIEYNKSFFKAFYKLYRIIEKYIEEEEKKNINDKLCKKLIDAEVKTQITTIEVLEVFSTEKINIINVDGSTKIKFSKFLKLPKESDKMTDVYSIYYIYLYNQLQGYDTNKQGVEEKKVLSNISKKLEEVNYKLYEVVFIQLAPRIKTNRANDKIVTKLLTDTLIIIKEETNQEKVIKYFLHIDDKIEVQSLMFEAIKNLENYNEKQKLYSYATLIICNKWGQLKIEESKKSLMYVFKKHIEPEYIDYVMKQKDSIKSLEAKNFVDAINNKEEYNKVLLGLGFEFYQKDSDIS